MRQTTFRGIIGMMPALGAGFLAIILAGCTTVPTRPSEILPLVEVQINNTPTHADDYASLFSSVHLPGRMRVTNPNTSIAGGIHYDVPVTLANIGPCGSNCGKLLFASTSNGSYSPTLPLTIPRTGAWVPFWVRAQSDASSLTATDAVLEVREHRSAGNVLARHGMSASDVNTIINQSPAAIIEIAQTPLSLDDYLTWMPTPARVRLAVPNGLSAPLAVQLRNAAPSPGADAPGLVRFAPDTGNGPPDPATMTATLSVSLPQNGADVPFFVAGDFGHPSARDKDAIIEVFDPAAVFPARSVIEHIGAMVRIRKNANALTDNERDRFLNAVATLNQGTAEYPNDVQINGAVGARAYSVNPGAPSPAFLPWHRLFLVRFERALQGLDPSVALPYWRYDQAAPALFSQDFMGARDLINDGPVVLTATSNPLHGWAIQRMSSFTSGASPTTSGPAACHPLSESNTLNLLGSTFQTSSGGFLAMEWLSSDKAVHAAAGDCTGFSGETGWLAVPATAVRDPLFFLLYANTDRLWAKWQRLNLRSDPAVAASYGVPACNLPLGQCLRDKMWPWSDPNAPGGRFPVGLITSYLQPPDQPTPADAIGLDHTVTWNLTGPQWFRLPGGLGYSYDDVPPAP